MSEEVIVQTIKKQYPGSIDAGIAYYTFITNINNIKLSKREIQLLAYVNHRGTISSASAREEFCNMFDSSEGTISNMISKLSKHKLLVKEKNKTKLNASLRMNFDKKIVLKVHLNKFLEDDLDNEKKEVVNGD